MFGDILHVVYIRFILFQRKKIEGSLPSLFQNYIPLGFLTKSISEVHTFRVPYQVYFRITYFLGSLPNLFQNYILFGFLTKSISELPTFIVTGCCNVKNCTARWSQ
jgi:hypothetical protein